MEAAAAGFVMMFSNVAISLLSMIIGVICIRKLCKKHQLSFWSSA